MFQAIAAALLLVLATRGLYALGARFTGVTQNLLKTLNESRAGLVSRS